MLPPTLRCTLRDIAHHPWLLTRTQLTPDEVTIQMKERSVYYTYDTIERVIIHLLHTYQSYN